MPSQHVSVVWVQWELGLSRNHRLLYGRSSCISKAMLSSTMVTDITIYGAYFVPNIDISGCKNKTSLFFPQSECVTATVTEM